MKVLVPLAPGFEEIEAITIVDLLRRAQIDVTTAGLGDNPVKGAHNITVSADIDIAAAESKNYAAIILPGGMPGSRNLRDSVSVISLVDEINHSGGIVAAICAAPIALGKAGILKGKKAVCYPGFEDELTGAVISSEPVAVDGNIVTGKGPGCAIIFALKLIELLINRDIADKVKESLQIC